MNNVQCGYSNLMDVVKKGEIYLTFIFNGIDSRTMGVASVTNGGTYDTPILPIFNDNFLEVDGYNGRYYFNSKMTQKDFVYNCFIDNLSSFQFEQIKTWLRPNIIGKLIRPEEPYKFYWVKVTSIDNLSNIPLTHPIDGGVSYTGSFSVTFSTIGQACSTGMIYYKEDLQYYEYGDIFDIEKNGYYDMGLLYKEETLPTNFSLSKGKWNPRLYNPGTYNSKLILKITTEQDINTGNITITNNSTGDVSVITLNNFKSTDTIVIDWLNGIYKINEEDYSKNVTGDIIFLQPRNYIEKIDNATVSNDTNYTYIKFDKKYRQVRREDIGKTAMFKSEYSTNPESGVGGNIIDINVDDNSFKLEKDAGLLSNPNVSLILTQLDDITGEINIPEQININIECKIEPRYL